MLDHLKYTNCPVCNAGIRKMVKESKHSNGHWNESIEFDCQSSMNNCIVSWSPNFMSEKLERSCPNAHKLFMQMKNK